MNWNEMKIAIKFEIGEIENYSHKCKHLNWKMRKLRGANHNLTNT